MTRKNVIVSAIELLSTVEGTTEAMENMRAETIEALKTILEQLNKRSTVSEEKKAEVSAKRKAATAEARGKLIAEVAPVLRKYLAADVTAKELFETAKGELPADFSAAKVQNILIRELAPELVKTETKGKPNTYRLA